MSAGLLAGIGVTLLSVYDGAPGPDGVVGGCAHVHGITDEAYFVVEGSGALELHDHKHGFRSVPLRTGSFVQFTPGTLHRAVNDGGLKVVCLMSNAGLAERGDARIYFGPEADGDPTLYQSLWKLPAEKGMSGALERRDRSAAGYSQLLKLWQTDREAYRKRLDEFVALHMAAIAKIKPDFETIVQQGPASWLDGALSRLGQLPAMTAGSDAMRGEAESGEQKLGMCGLLRPVHLTGSV
jgi:mannose-6-phosphate isomerase-like protein (cupin superfamily)